MTNYLENNLESLYQSPEKLGYYLGYDKLSAIHGEWIKYIWGDGQDVVLMAHRNSYKTTACLIVGAIWYLLFRPDSTILFLRKSDDKASGIIEAITKHMKSDDFKALIFYLFNTDFNLSDCNRSRINFPLKQKITKESSIDAYGIGTDITGSHYDRIIADDIVTIKDRISKAERERTKSLVRELTNIKNANGKAAYTGTPWHKDDAFSILPDPVKYPIGTLDIPDFTPEKIQEIQSKTTRSLYAVNYMLEHVADEDRIFTDIKYSAWDITKSCNASIDPAYSGKNTTSLTLLQKNNNVYIVKGYVWEQSIIDIYDKIIEVLRQHNCGTLYIEDNADKGLSRKEFERRGHSAIIGFHESTNKHIKIINYVKGNWDKIYFDYNCQDEYLNQIGDYVEGDEPDDAPDSLAMIIRALFDNVLDMNTVGAFEYDNDFKY